MSEMKPKKEQLLEILNKKLKSAKNIVYSPHIANDGYKSYWQGRLQAFEEAIHAIKQLEDD